jgi:hypothetical protein
MSGKILVEIPGSENEKAAEKLPQPERIRSLTPASILAHGLRLVKEYDE